MCTTQVLTGTCSDSAVFLIRSLTVRSLAAQGYCLTLTPVVMACRMAWKKKKNSRGRYFLVINNLEAAVQAWKWGTPKKLFQQGMERLSHRWYKYIQIQTLTVEKEGICADLYLTGICSKQVKYMANKYDTPLKHCKTRGIHSAEPHCQCFLLLNVIQETVLVDIIHILFRFSA